MLQVVFLGTPKTYLPYRLMAVRDWKTCATWSSLNLGLAIGQTAFKKFHLFPLHPEQPLVKLDHFIKRVIGTLEIISVGG